jgi:hypothetical protein
MIKISSCKVELNSISKKPSPPHPVFFSQCGGHRQAFFKFTPLQQYTNDINFVPAATILTLNMGLAGLVENFPTLC